MLILDPQETEVVRATVKALAAERNDLEFKLEQAESKIHRQLILIDNLRRELRDAQARHQK